MVTASRAGAEPEPPNEPAELPTFRYTSPAEPRPLRAILEFGAVFALGFAWYATTSTDIVRQWDVGYDWETFENKITGDAFGPDTNAFGTNFIGHPLGGTSYYLAARSNRLGILQSFGFSIAGSLMWELLGEVSEIVSMNDMLVTPLAGLAIGESTTQLGAFFDRSDQRTSHRVAGSLFGPMKSLNDALDGLKPARAEQGYPAFEFHRFELAAGTAIAIETPSNSAESETFWPEFRARATSHLVRLPGFDGSGSGNTSFDDGNVSDMSLELAIGKSGVSDVVFASDVMLGGVYWRGRFRDRDGAPWGSNVLLGVSSGFEYALHDYRRGDDAPADRMAVVRPLCAAFEARGAVGGPIVTTRVRIGPAFGGANAHASGHFSEADAVPRVLGIHGYYFGLGADVLAGVGVEAGALKLDAQLSGQALRAVGGPGEPVSVLLADSRTRGLTRIGYHIPRSIVALETWLERRTRLGRSAEARARDDESSIGAGIGAFF